MTKNLSNILTKEMLKYNYEKYGSMQKMADALYISIDSIYKYMKLYNIYYHQYYNGLYDCNENIFDSDTEISFYLAGFIAADGTILDGKQTNILKIGLSKKDQSHLEKIKLLFNSNHPLEYYRSKDGNESCSIRFVSNKLCESIKRFNVVPRKTFIYTFPKFILNHPLKHHFMRGYFDGDGCITITKAKPPRTVSQGGIGLRGTYDVLYNYNKILEKECSLKEKLDRVKKYDSIECINYNGNKQVRKIIEFLYKDATIYLDRKYEIAKNILSI